MANLSSIAHSLFGRLSFCALNGALVGLLAGLLFGLLLLEYGSIALHGRDLLACGLTLGLFGWLIVLLVVGVWLRYGVRAIALPALVNALLTSVVSVYVNRIINVPALSSLIGLLIGILIGAMLCRLCNRLQNQKVIQTGN